MGAQYHIREIRRGRTFELYIRHTDADGALIDGSDFDYTLTLKRTAAAAPFATITDAITPGSYVRDLAGGGTRTFNLRLTLSDTTTAGLPPVDAEYDLFYEPSAGGEIRSLIYGRAPITN